MHSHEAKDAVGAGSASRRARLAAVERIAEKRISLLVWCRARVHARLVHSA